MIVAPALWVTLPGSIGWTAPLFWKCPPSHVAASWSTWPVDRAEIAASGQSNAQISKPTNRRSRNREPLLNLSPVDECDAEFEGFESIDHQEILPVPDRPQRVGLKKSKGGKVSGKAGSKRSSGSTAEEGDFETSTLMPRMSASIGKRSVIFPRRKLSTQEWEEQVYHMVKQQKYQAGTALKDIAQNGFQQVPQRMTAPTVGRLPRKAPEPLRAPKYDSGVSKIEDARFEYLRRQLGLESKWQPLVEYLFTLGLGSEDFQKIAQRHKACLQLNVDVVTSRVEFLVSLGIKREVLKKLIVRHPQIVEYRVDSLRPRLDYLKHLGIPESSLGKVITLAPSILEYSVRNSLKPRVKYLLDVVGIRAADIPKLVTRSPQVLTQSIEESMEPQVNFFLQEIKIKEAALAKIITKHPQILHYSVDDGIRPRIAFLKSIGMSDQDIVKVLTRMAQVLSLSVENSLKPKYEYLVKELKGGVRTVVSFPAYFTLSLEHRIKPRHKFLITLQKLPKGPFPMKCLAVTDEYFCSHWAKASLKDYSAFRDALLLRNFAEKFEKKNTVQL